MGEFVADGVGRFVEDALFLQLRGDDDAVLVDEEDEVEEDADDDEAFQHARYRAKELVEEFGFDHLEEAFYHFAQEVGQHHGSNKGDEEGGEYGAFAL